MGDHADDAVNEALDAYWDWALDDEPENTFGDRHCVRKSPFPFHPWHAQPRTMNALKAAIDAKRQKGKKMPPPKRKPPTAQQDASAGLRVVKADLTQLTKKLPPARKPVPGAGKTLMEVFHGSGAPLGSPAEFPVSVTGHTPSDELTTLVIGAAFDVMKPTAKAFPSIPLTTLNGAEIRAASNGRFVYWWVGGTLYALRLDDVTNAVLKTHAKRGG